jgi:hypothetical protein
MGEDFIHGEVPYWLCVACGAIQPETGDYPEKCWSCWASAFIRDTLPPRYRTTKTERSGE